MNFSVYVCAVGLILRTAAVFSTGSAVVMRRRSGGTVVVTDSVITAVARSRTVIVAA